MTTWTSLVYCLILLVVANSFSLFSHASGVIPLPRLSIDPDGISISGLSSGADFTVQFQVAYSSILAGSGVFAGQTYHCAVTRFPNDKLVNGSDPSVPICDGCPPNTTLIYDHCKNHPDWIDTEMLTSYTRQQATLGTIDDISHLSKSRVYLYRGTKDACYHSGSVDAVRRFFMNFVKDSEQILFNNTIPSAHCWPTADYGTPCGKGVIENCNYDGPGDALQHIYQHTLNPPATAYDPDCLFEFDQTPFAGPTPNITGMAQTGFVYIPKTCNTTEGSDSQCKLHLSLHGCGVQGYYDKAVHHLGFNRWAESNNLVIVFPRIAPHGTIKQEKSGCWDGYAQTGANYALKNGKQMLAARAIIQQIAGI